MSNNLGHDADVIEEDIRHTQDEIGATIHKLEEQLTPRQITRSFVGEDRADLIDEVLELARRNPIPVALIAVGAIWLLSASGSGSFNRLAQRLNTPDHSRTPAPMAGDDAVGRASPAFAAEPGLS